MNCVLDDDLAKDNVVDLIPYDSAVTDDLIQDSITVAQKHHSDDHHGHIIHGGHHDDSHQWFMPMNYKGPNPNHVNHHESHHVSSEAESKAAEEAVAHALGFEEPHHESGTGV